MNGHKLLKLTLLALACLSAVLAACQKQKTGEATRQAGPPRTLAEFEKATAGQSPTQIGQFVLKNYGCAECHSLADDGKFGLTAKGEAGSEGFEGCKPLLAGMNIISLTAEDKRTAADRKQARMFQDFGCAFCHQIKPGGTGYTEIGAKLGFFHLGCFEGVCCTADNPDSKKSPEAK